MKDKTSLESKSVYVIREAYYRFKSLAVLWSMGKDSTTLLWLCRKAFFGKIPFHILHIDTTYKFPEMYAFRKRIAKEWGLNLKIVKNEVALEKGIGYETHDAATCSHELKTVALQEAISKLGYEALLVGIRRDEHGIRAKERYFSSRDREFSWDPMNQQAEIWELYLSSIKKGEHMRVHPLLHWSELAIWQYIKSEQIPTCSLYFAKNELRYRSLGCMPITSPIKSEADSVDKIIEELKKTKISERSGRAQDKETIYTMQKLRSLGYM